MAATGGKRAEELVAAFLQDHDFRILDRNWRNRWCELDIVASKQNRVHFVEVKYRRSSSAGAGYEYVTPEKLRRLRQAALHWNTYNRWQGDYCIDVASVTGSDDIDYIEDVQTA